MTVSTSKAWSFLNGDDLHFRELSVSMASATLCFFKSTIY